MVTVSQELSPQSLHWTAMLPGGHLSLPCVSYHRLLAFPEAFAFIPWLLLQQQKGLALWYLS